MLSFWNILFFLNFPLKITKNIKQYLKKDNKKERNFHICKILRIKNYKLFKCLIQF